MPKTDFKKYRLLTVLINLAVLVIFIALATLSIFNKGMNDVLFTDNFLPHWLSDNNLFNLLWIPAAILLFSVNKVYFEEKDIYKKKAGVFVDEEKRIRRSGKELFYVSLILMIIDFAVLPFSVYVNLTQKYSFPYSEQVMFISFLSLPILIGIVIAALVSKK